MIAIVHYLPRPCSRIDAGASTDDDTQVTCPTCRRANGFALRTLTDGKQIYPEHTNRRPNGQQQDYVVLSESERERGFVRPVRDAYRHLKCGKITTMGRALAETYARDPDFYSGTFCATCRDHFPVGEDGEFVWFENDGRDGPKVGT